MTMATATDSEQKKEQTKMLWTGLQPNGELQDKTRQDMTILEN
jgi:hypothetical protein